MNYLADGGIAGLAALGCGLAAIAWQDPDAFAPIQDDPTSWNSPSDRYDTSESGATWTPIACTTALAFTASSIYGYYAKDPNDGDADRFNASFDNAMSGGAAFVGGMNAAEAPPRRTNPAVLSTTPEPPEPRACASDYECLYGWACVKEPYHSVGTCAQKVDRAGVPTNTGPDPRSLGPGDDSGCLVDTECPVGFRCVRHESVRGNCMK